MVMSATKLHCNLSVSTLIVWYRSFAFFYELRVRGLLSSALQMFSTSLAKSPTNNLQSHVADFNEKLFLELSFFLIRLYLDAWKRANFPEGSSQKNELMKF